MIRHVGKSIRFCKKSSQIGPYFSHAVILGPVHTAPPSYENGAKLIRFGLAFTLLRCENGASRKREWKRINLKTVRFECGHQKRRHLKTLYIPLLKGYSWQWHSNSRLAPSRQLLKNWLEKGLTTPFCWSSVNAYRFHSVFIWRRSNVNGLRFHQQKRMETKTEHCERSLRFGQNQSYKFTVFWIHKFC